MAGIPSQTITVPFTGGLDQKKDPWLVEAGKATSITNGVFTKVGQLRKRLGFTAQAKTALPTGPLTIGRKLFFRKYEQLLAERTLLRSYAPAISTHMTVDQLPLPVVTRSSVFDGASTFTDSEVAIGNGYEVYVWRAADKSTAGDIYMTVVDATTGAPILTNYQVTTGATYFHPRVIWTGTICLITYISVGSTNIICRWFDAATPLTVNVASNLVVDFVGPQMIGPSLIGVGYDVCNIVGSTDFTLAYESTTGGANKISLRRFSSALGLAVQVYVANEIGTAFLTMSICSNLAETLYVSYSNFTGAGTEYAWCAGADPTTLAQTFVPTVIFTVAGVLNYIPYLSVCRHTSVNAVFIGLAASNAYDMLCIRITSGGIVLGTIRQQKGFYASSKCFVYDGRVLVAAVIAPTWAGQGTTFILDTQIQDTQALANANMRVVATVAPRVTNNTATKLQRSANSLCSVPATADANIFVTLGSIIRNADVRSVLGLVRLNLDFANTARWAGVELGESLHISGGTPLAYDGRTTSEIGFYYFPPSIEITSTPSNVGGAFNDNGVNSTWNFVFTYEWTDAAGQIHRSAPSGIVTLYLPAGTTATGSIVFSTIPHLWATNRQDDLNAYVPQVTLVGYRTAKNGTVYYRESPDAGSATTNNTPLGGTFTYTSTYSVTDAVLATNPLLYTTGGILPNVCPPSAPLMVTHRNRLWLGGADDPRVIWYSKTFTPGEAVAFCDAFTLTVQDAGGVTAIASMDDYFIIFKRYAIYIVTGDGPDDSGNGSTLSAPRKVCSDVGCINPNSVVLTPDGLMFASEVGLMILDRSLQVQYIGAGIEDSFRANPIITSAVLVGAQNEVRFTATPTVGSATGISMVFNYLQKFWYTHQYYDGDKSQASASAAHAVLSPSGVYTWVTPFGQIYTEKGETSGTAYLDGSTWITMSIESAWMGRPDLAQRVRKAGVFGSALSNANVSVSLAFDRATSYAQAYTYLSQTNGNTSGSVLGTLMRVGSQNGASPRCETIRVKIVDATPTSGVVGTGQGVSLTSLAFEVAPRGGIRRQGTGAKV